MSADQTLEKDLPTSEENFTEEETLNAVDQVSINSFSSTSRQQFFEGGERGQILDVLPLLQMEGKNCVIVEGDQGMGKSTIAQQIFLQSQDSGVSTIKLQGSQLSSDDGAEILKQFQTFFKLTAEEIIGCINSDNLAALAQQKISQKFIFIIDDAQDLSSSAVTFIADFMAKMPQDKCQFILLILPSSAVVLANPEMQDYLAEHGHQINLRPLNSKETCDYVRFLLIASEQEHVKLSRPALSRLFQSSGGIPSKVNESLVYALHELEHPAEEKKQRSEIVPKWHLVSLSLVAVGVIALIVFGNPEKSSEPRFSETIKSMPADESAEYQAPPIRFTDAQSPQPLQGYDRNNADNQPQSEAENQPAYMTQQEVQQHSRQTAQSDKYEIDNYEAERVVPAEPENRSSETVRAPAEPTTQVENTKVSMATQLAKLKAQQSAPASAKPAASQSSDSGDAQWVKSMSPSRYTLQLLGGANKSAIEKFVRENGSYRKMGYFQTTRQGQPWYVVVYGDFPSKAQAVAAADQLPSTLTPSKPWPRSAGDIQSQMQ